MTTTRSSLRQAHSRVRLGVAVTAVALATALGSQSVYAQAQPTPTAPDEDAPVVLEEMVVNTVRGSLITAQEIKQNSPEFVDSIVAQDIGKLPDNTVADALQRVPGIQVSRSAGEANTVVIRGLPNIETTINGYEVFTGVGRGVALQDIPAEMLAGVDAYKSVGPDKIEGGVAGLIDVRLRRPFDSPGRTISVIARGVYGDQSGKTSYSLGALLSNRWKISSGEFGALFDVSFARRDYEDQVVDNYVHFGANGELFNIATDSTGTRGFFADNFGIQLSPGKRKRPAASLMLQWKLDSGMEIYWDNLYTGFENRRITDFFIAIPSWDGFRDNVVLYPAGNDGWVNDGNRDGTPDRFVQSLVAHNTNTLTSKQSYLDRTDSYQGAIGTKWSRENRKVSAELSYSDSTFKPRSVILDTKTVSPSLAISYNDNNAASVQASGIDYTNPANYQLVQLFDQWQRSASEFYALRSDVAYTTDHNVFKEVQFGLRYSTRDVEYTSANNGGIFRWDAAPANSIPGLGRVSNSDPFVSARTVNVRQWWSADEKFLLNETNTLRPIFGQPLGLPPADPSRTFLDSEDTLGGYVLTKFSADWGSTPVDGVIGARAINTRQDLTGFEREVVNGSSTGNFLPTTVHTSDTEILPTLNSRMRFTDQALMRFSFTKTMTRPNFSDLNPATSLTSPGPTLPGQGSGGNPDLDPIRSTNYDLSLEYYFSDSNSASIAAYYRSLDGYIQSYASEETIDGRIYTVTRPRSTDNGYLQGFEASYQYFFEAFKGFGVQANYTYIKGETEDPVTGTKHPIAQVSENNYNLILIYEKDKFSNRLAYNWRGDYIAAFNQSGLQPTTVWVGATDRLDYSASYAITDKVTITFDATNILGSKYRDTFGGYAMFSRDVRNYDRTYELGLRCRF